MVKLTDGLSSNTSGEKLMNLKTRPPFCQLHLTSSENLNLA